MTEERRTEVDRMEQRIRDYKDVFGSDAGLRVFEDLKETCYFYEPSFTTDPYQAAFNEGQRAVVLHVRTMVEMNLEQIRALRQKEETNG